MAELTCPKCRKANPADALICQYCDTPLVTFLPRDPVDNSPLSAEPIVQGETQPTIPDWLAAIRDQKQKDGLDQPVPEEPEKSDQEKADLDSWLEKLRGNSLEPDSIPSKSEESPEDENLEEEGITTPSWLASIRSKINIENPPVDESVPTDPGIDWLTKLRKQTEELSLPPEVDESQGASAEILNEGISLDSRLPELEPDLSTLDNNELENTPDSILPLVTKESEDVVKQEEPGLEETYIPDVTEVADHGTLPSPSAMFDDSDQPSEKITTKGLPDWLSSFIGVGEGENTPESALVTGSDDEAGGNNLEPGAIPSWVRAMRPVEKTQGDVQAQKEADRRFEDSGPLAGIRGILPGSEVEFNYSQPSVKENRETSLTNISLFENTLKIETEEKKVPIYKRSKTSNVVRWIIAVVLLLVVALIQVGGNPPDLLPKNLPEETMAFFRSVSALSQGANILLVLDYDPAYSSEIEAAVNAPISLMMVKQANLFTLSTAPTNLFLADNLIKSVGVTHPSAAEKYVSGEKYQVLGYLPGGQSGMQNLLRDFKGSLPVGLNLEKTIEMTSLTGIKTLNDFEAIMILTDNPDTARTWVEQVGPTLTKPAVWMVVSSQVIALVRPYVRSGQIDGLISGVYGAASFEQIIQQPGAAAQIWNGYYTAILLSMVMIIAGGFVNFIGFSILRARIKREVVMNTMDLIWAIIGFVLSLLIFSYLIGDNPLFRFAASLFIGVTAGYAAVILLYQVIIPRLIYPFLSGTIMERSFTLIPLVLSVLLFFKPSRNLSAMGSIPMALLVAAGAAFALSGAVLGTILPQSQATINLFGNKPGENFLLEGIVILVGTVTTLMYFYFGAKFENGKPIRRAGWIESISKVGQVFLFVTLGSIYAGVYITAITALVERMHSVWTLFGLIK